MSAADSELNFHGWSARASPRLARSPCHSRSVNRIGRALQELLRELPVPLRYAFLGAVTLGLPGGVVGLIRGLRAYRRPHGPPFSRWACQRRFLERLSAS